MKVGQNDKFSHVPVQKSGFTIGVIFLLFLSGCLGPSDNYLATPDTVVFEPFAEQFAEHLVQGKFDTAHGMLSDSLKKKMSISKLQLHFERMVGYGSGKPTVDGIVEKMTEWPDKFPNDVGWAYVSISGEDYLEAVTVIVCLQPNGMKIRQIEWGRP